MSRPRSGVLLTAVAALMSACGARPPAFGAGLHAASVSTVVPARADTMPLLLFLSPGHDDGRLWPAVLYLHSGSHRGGDLETLKGYGPPRLLANGWTPPFIVIAPQLPEGEIWSDAPALVSLLDELSRTCPIDPDRLYATGASMGGRGVWYLAYRCPEPFAAIAPVAAFQPITRRAASGRLASVPVRAIHGPRDDLAPAADATALHQALQATGGRAELILLEGRDHFLADVLEDPEPYRWLLRHPRSAALPEGPE